MRTSLWISLLMGALAASSAKADSGDEVCFPLFQKAGAVPLTRGCPLSCAVAPTGMGTFFCTANGGKYIERYCGDLCYKEVVDLSKLPRPEGSPTNGFTNIQTCIARRSCLNKDKLQNPKWLDAVVRDFVSPFVQKKGRWPQTMAACEPAWFMRDLRCQQDMATYHIDADLQASLNANGCGSQGDWDKVGQHIADCTTESLPPGAGLYARNEIRKQRNQVRERCIAYRKSKQLPIDFQASPETK